VSLSVPDAGAAIPVLLRQLEAGGVRIAGLQMSHPSLDDVFLRYTGRSIREETADAYNPIGWG
jgi:ABC-2 type transport system ATP-binding protein